MRCRSQSPARSDRQEWQECDEWDKITKSKQTLFCCRRCCPACSFMMHRFFFPVAIHTQCSLSSHDQWFVDVHLIQRSSFNLTAGWRGYMVCVSYSECGCVGVKRWRATRSSVSGVWPYCKRRVNSRRGHVSRCVPWRLALSSASMEERCFHLW